MGTMLTITSLSGKLYHFGRLVEAFAAVEVEPRRAPPTSRPARCSRSCSPTSGGAPSPGCSSSGSRRSAASRATTMPPPPAGSTSRGVYYSRLLGSDPWHTLAISRQGSDAFEQAGSTRNYVFLNNFTGIVQAELGDPDAGAATMRRVLLVAQKLNEASPCSRTGVCLAFILCFHGPTSACDEAIQLADHTVKTRGINSIYLGMAHDVLGHAHLRKRPDRRRERESRAPSRS